MLLPLIKSQIESADHITEPDAKHDNIQPNPPILPLKRLPLNWQLPESLNKQIVINMNQEKDPSLNRPELSDLVARSAGTIFHRLAANIIQDKSIEPAMIGLALKRMGLDPISVTLAQKLVLTGLENILEDKNGRWLLDASHQEKQTEWQLTIKTPYGFENQVIDYAFVDSEGTRWIVDFKLTHNTQLAFFDLEHEVEKYRAQLAKYVKTLRTLENRPIRCGLYFPIAKIWHEII
jgi:hypothetical protein